MAKNVPEKYAEYVVTDLPKYAEVGGHHKPVPQWIASGMFPGVKFEVAGIDATKLIGAPHAVPHTHDVPEIYLCVSEKRGEVVIEIQMDDEKFVVESPFAVFVPPQTTHCFIVLKCDKTNYVFGMVLKDWKKE